MSGACTIAGIYFGVLLLVMILSFFTGKYFLKFVLNYSFRSPYAAIFFNVLIGSIVTVVVTSLLCTSGKSINFIYLFILVFVLVEKRISKKIKDPVTEFKIEINKELLLKVAFICAAAFTWNASIILKSGNFPIQKIEKDSFYYGEISKNLIETGQENTFVTANLVNEAYHFPTPYHYFELWLNGITAKFFHLNYSLSLILVTYAFFMTLFSLGILALIERYKKTEWKHVLLSFTLIFVSGTYLTERGMNITRYIAQMEGLGERYGGKLAPIYCLSLAFIYLFAVMKTKKSFLILLLMPLFSISLAPAVLGGLTLFCIWQLFKERSARVFYTRMLLYTFLTGTLIAAFYYVLYKNSLNFRFDKHLNEYSDLNEFSFFRIKFFLVELFLKVWAHPFLFILNYLPFIIIPFILLITKSLDVATKKLFLLVIFIYFAGLIAYNSLYLMDDAFQLYINPLAILHATLAFCLTLLIPVKVKLKWLLTGIFICGLGYNMIQGWTSYKRIDYFNCDMGEDYVISVNKLVEKKGFKLKGGIFYDKTFYRNLLISYPLEYFSMPFVLSPDIFSPLNLTSIEMEEKWNISQMQKDISKSPFTQFLIEERKLDVSRSVLDCQLDFIKEQKLNYLIVPPSDTTDYSRYLKFETILKDKKSGQSFILLKNN